MNKKNPTGRREVIARDAGGLKKFWEKKIEKQTVEHQSEHERKNKSALTKLRQEWTQMLESRIKMLQCFHEDQKRQLYAGSKESSQNNVKTTA
ncbi:hypothetical protein GDO86_001507 [Hymenochirus boettgeri]|uniref:F240B protein n=1 Tax=Hymenochirus boettgeri TaxID=247094 RepID=A0A8T2KLA0_9PIPI|nr:hypothetical protein GDO86_001507 [Hymenochirus boettgeri]